MADEFQSRDEIVQFIEERAAQAVEKAAQPARRLPWVTAGPVGQDSAGYSVLKAAAFALGYVGPEQAKEEIRTHQQLRDLYAGYGFSPHHGAQSFLVPPGERARPGVRAGGAEVAQRTAPEDDRARRQVRPGRGRLDRPQTRPLRAQGARHPHRASPPAARSYPPAMLGELIDLQRSLEVFAVGRGDGRSPSRRAAAWRSRR